MKKLLVIIISIFSGTLSHASTFYWVGGVGNWSDFASHWATSSGGSTFHTQIPSSLDDVIFDSNSFTASGQTVNVNQTIAYCKNMDWTGAKINSFFACGSSSTKIKVYGSLTLAPSMNITLFTGTISFESLNSGNKIKTSDNVLPCPIEFNGFGGEWTLQDSLKTTSFIYLNFGTLRTNNNNISCVAIGASNLTTPCGLYLGTSTVTVQGFSLSDTAMTFDGDSSVIIISGSGISSDLGNHVSTFNIIKFVPVSFNDQRVMVKNGRIKKVYYAGNYNHSVDYPSAKLEIDSIFSTGTGSFYLKNCSGVKINYAECPGNFYLQSTSRDTINTMSVVGNATIDQSSGRCVFGKILFSKNLTISSASKENEFRHCEILEDGYLLGDSCYFDTLKLNVGRTYTWGCNKTQFIKKWFDCFGNPGFPIQLVSDTFGQQATLSIGQNMFCSDYLYMRDMKGQGSLGLYAGSNSNSVFNNSGWIFSSCIGGVNELNGVIDISIYPNPATDGIMVKSDRLNFPVAILISDVYGNSICKSELKNIHSAVTLPEHISSGMYFYSILSEGMEIAQGKIVVR